MLDCARANMQNGLDIDAALSLTFTVLHIYIPLCANRNNIVQQTP